MEQNGRFIVIEGIDGAGKTTVSERLCKNHDCTYMTQPEDTWVGEAARRALDEDIEPACDLFLHMAAHANQQSRLESELNSSDVVMDRYYHSRVAYQSVQTHFTASEIQDMHTGWSIKPSTVVILDMPPEISLKRKGESGDKFEKHDFLSEVRSVYRECYENYDNVVFVNGEKSQDEVYRKVESEVFG